MKKDHGSPDFRAPFAMTPKSYDSGMMETVNTDGVAGVITAIENME